MRYVSKQIKTLCLTVLMVLLSLQAFADESDFPVPDSIRPAIAFWVKVYTEVDTRSGFLHDSLNLSVIYQRLERDRRTINQEREKIVEDLRFLATGERDNLSAAQEEILSLWPTGTSNERFATAAGNVRWQLGQSDRFAAGLKRSGAYRAHIEAVVLEKGMPIELGVLPHVESSFNPGAYSSAAATGMWQFVRATASRFMQVDYVVDERLDPYVATYGAMELLEFNYKTLGTWPLALTAYNHGVNGMARAVKAVGSDDIGRIIDEYKGSRFGFASRNFYPQFLAVQEVENRAEEFYGDIEFDPSPDFQTYELVEYLDATVLAESLGVSINELTRDNPALQPSVWSGTKRIPAGYEIKLKRSVFEGDMLAGISGIPGSQRFSEQIPDVSYTVGRGDSLSVIASRFDTSVSELVAINQLRDRNRIRIGQTLLLPQPDGSIPTLIVSVSDRREIPENGRYEVQRGDSISLISERFQVPEETLIVINSLSNQSVIFPGQSLNLRSMPAAVNVAGLGTAMGSPNSSVAVDQTPENQINEIDTESTQSIQQAQVSSQTLVASVEESFSTQAQRATISTDSNSPALAVDERIATVEVEQQVSLDLETDPSDYSVAEDQTVEIQAIETLGHYADWLDIRAQDLRQLNGLSFNQQLIVGSRLKLDFSTVNTASFESKRRRFHRDFQNQYFASWRIRETEEYSIKSRDYLAKLTRDRSVPMWLFRQYNPGVDSGRLQIGQVIVFPVVERL